MAQTNANLLDHVLPANVPIGQRVLTVPHALRARLAYDGLLLGAMVRLFADTVLGWYRRRMEIAGAAGGRGCAVTVVQRVSSDLRYNPHVHAMFVDGVFVPAAADSVPTFHALPHISDTAVADVLQISRARILRLLIRRGVIDVADDVVSVTEDLAGRDPVLAALATASVLGLPQEGARRGPAVPRRPEVHRQLDRAQLQPLLPTDGMRRRTPVSGVVPAHARFGRHLRDRARCSAAAPRGPMCRSTRAAALAFRPYRPTGMTKDRRRRSPSIARTHA